MIRHLINRSTSKKRYLSFYSNVYNKNIEERARPVKWDINISEVDWDHRSQLVAKNIRLKKSK